LGNKECFRLKLQRRERGPLQWRSRLLSQAGGSRPLMVSSFLLVLGLFIKMLAQKKEE
jgi:hypothetical protein